MNEMSPSEHLLSRAALDDLVRRGFTRRQMLRVAALVGVSTVLPFGSERALAQLSNAGVVPDDAVKINANEFPEGPSAHALDELLAAARAATATSTPKRTGWSRRRQRSRACQRSSSLCIRDRAWLCITR